METASRWLAQCLWDVLTFRDQMGARVFDCTHN
jgi:hypothetical protein